MPLPGYSEFTFQDRRYKPPHFPEQDNGPGVLIMHELPGMTQQCIGLAKRVVEAGFTVFLPLLFGKPNDTATVANTIRVCVSHEFKRLAARKQPDHHLAEGVDQKDLR
jgi:dienelactone hydrolase